MHTPCSVITDLDSSNSLLSSLSHLNGVPGFSDWRNGSMCSVAVKAHTTWFISPNQGCTSVMFAGVWKSQIAPRYFLHAQTLVEAILKLTNSTVSAPNTNLAGLKMMPLWPEMSSHSTAWIVNPEECVINVFGLVRNMGDNLVKPSGVAIT